MNLRVCIIRLFLPFIFVLTSCTSNIDKELNAQQVFNGTSYSIIEISITNNDEIESVGTGFFIKDKIISCLHVVSFETIDELVFFENINYRYYNDETIYKATVDKYDKVLDICILNPDANDNYKNLNYSTSDNQYGEDIYAIGNLNGHGLSIEKGIISIPKLNVETPSGTREVMQLDINIAHGNSGSPVINTDLEVIGMISFRMKDTNGNIIYGTAFAITITKILEFID